MCKVGFLSHSCTILAWIFQNLIGKALNTHAMLFSCFSKCTTLRFLYINIFATSKLRNLKFLSKLFFSHMLFCFSLCFSSTLNLTKELMTLIVIPLLHLSLRAFHLCHNCINLRLLPLLHQNF
jgi:hypothetical protein